MKNNLDDIKILLVEDELIIGEHISRELGKHGYVVIAILTKGEHVLEFLASTEPDIIIMDINLAGQLDGIETAMMVADNYSIPVIFLTANVDNATFERSRSAKPYAFIGKPFKSKELIRTIQLVMQRVLNLNE